MRCVRIWFSKNGRIKYVSHLDIMRSMTRTVRRAKIPLWYTEGFNPHPYLNFLQPLPLGVEGEKEPLDIRIEGDITNEKIKSDLNLVLPVGIEIKNVTEPNMKASDIAFADYEIFFENEDGLVDKLTKAMESGELSCEKMGKVNGRKKIKQVDVSGNIKNYEICQKDDCVVMNVTFPCGNTKNVNPMNLMTAVNSYLATEIVPVNVVRLALKDENMKDFE